MRKSRTFSAFIALFFLSILSQANAGVVESDGVPIHYELVGEGEPVVLLHGYTGSFEEHWGRAIGEFSDGYRLIGIDLRGHGGSGKPAEPAYGDFYIGDVIAVMDYLGIEDAHFAGFSLGGMVALKLAVEHPDRVRSLVMCGIGLGSFEEFKQTGDAFEAALKGAPTIMTASLRVFLGHLPEEERDIALIGVSEEQVEYVNSNNPAAMVAAIADVEKLAVSREDAAGIDVPVNAVMAENDIGTAQMMSLKAVQPDMGLFVVPQSTHFNLIRQPGFGAAVARFLNDASKSLPRP